MHNKEPFGHLKKNAYFFEKKIFKALFGYTIMISSLFFEDKFFKFENLGPGLPGDFLSHSQNFNFFE